MTQQLMTTVRHGGDWIFQPKHHANGISSFGDMKFYIALFLYLASFLVLAHDPFFHQHGAFVYKQGLVTLLLAAVIAASFNWEMCLFGKPVGANLLLHVIQLCPLSLFMARITAKASVPPEPNSLLGQVMKLLKDSVKEIFFTDFVEKIPIWVTDLITNWWICILLVLVLVFLSFRNLPLKVAAVICTLLFVPFASVIEKGASGCLLLGMILLGGGMAMQFCRYDKILYFENILHRLQASTSLDSMLAAVILRTMTDLQNQTRMSEKNLLSLVRAEYDPDGKMTPADLQLIAGEVLHRMVYEYDLVVVRGDAEGLFLKPNALLFCSDSLLTHLAVFPRVLLALVVAAIWLILPIDLLPDPIPYLGMLDDMTVAIFSGIVLRNSVEGHVQRRQ